MVKRIVCFVLSVICFLYGGCYLEKNGTDQLPTQDEFMEYAFEKKDVAVEAYHTIKDWVVTHFIES